MDKISVVVPVFNNEAYVKRSVRSLMFQTHRNLEIIIVNDGSTDHTQAVLEKLAREDVRISIINQANGGVSQARNAGLRQASGTYLAFLDSDDYIDATMYENMLALLKAEDADIVECGYSRFEVAGAPYDQVHFKEEILVGDAAIVKAAIQQQNTFCVVWNKLYKRELFEAVTFSNLALGEDYLVNFQIATKAQKKITLSASYCNYFVNEAGAVAAQFSLKWFDDIQSALLVYEELNSYPKYMTLLPHAALDIVDKVIGQYVSLYKFKVKDAKLNAYKKLLERTFAHYYPLIPPTMRKEGLAYKWQVASQLLNFSPQVLRGALKLMYL